jgi:ACS family hexuronate transporter-like MFS transporter
MTANLPSVESGPAGRGGGAVAPAPAASVGHYRWVICGLLFFAATVNYLDRNVIGILKPTLQQQFGWSEVDYGDIVFAFQLAYAIGLLLVGRLMDWLGTKKGFALALFVWSLAAIAHAEAPLLGGPVARALSAMGLTYGASVAGFIAVRFLLGLGEAGNFPASIKAVAEWFPKRERALATGVFNSGTNVGALVVPLLVPWITVTYGWYWAFVGTGLLGLLWLFLWWPLYDRPDRHPRVTPAELALIRSDPPESTAKVPLRAVLPHRQAWAFTVGKFLTDPVWWLYLFWIPDFLTRTFGVKLLGMMLPLLVIYSLATVGSIGGGWLSGSLLRRGWTVNAARKTAMLICAVAVIPIIFASRVESMWLAVVLVGLAAAAHQGWSANLFTIASDCFPRQAVGTVVGFGGMAGAVGGMLIAKITGYILQATGSYLPVFLIAGSAYLVALAIVQLLVPRLQPVRIDERRG